MDETSSRRPPSPYQAVARQTHDNQMHELRTPLTVALLRLSVLRRRLRRDGHHPELDDELQRIEEALNRLADVLTEMDRAPRPR